MTGTALIVLMLVSCAGCSSPATPTGTTPQPPPDAPTSHPTPIGEPVASAAQCERMIEHAVDLAVAQADFTPEERAQLERETRERYDPECRNLPATVIDCAITAPSLDDLAACSGHAE